MREAQQAYVRVAGVRSDDDLRSRTGHEIFTQMHGGWSPGGEGDDTASPPTRGARKDGICCRGDTGAGAFGAKVPQERPRELGQAPSKTRRKEVQISTENRTFDTILIPWKLRVIHLAVWLLVIGGV